MSGRKKTTDHPVELRKFRVEGLRGPDAGRVEEFYSENLLTALFKAKALFGLYSPWKSRHQPKDENSTVYLAGGKREKKIQITDLCEPLQLAV